MLVWTDSFESRNGVAGSKRTPQGTVIKSSITISSGASRTGSWACSAGYELTIGGTDRDSTMTIGFAGQMATITAEAEFLEFKGDSGGTQHLTFTIDGSGVIRAYRGSSAGTLLATGTLPAPTVANTFYYFEVHAVLSDTVGAVEVRVDENVVLTASSIDTKNAGTGTVFDDIWISGLNFTRFNSVDDVYVTNSAGSSNTGFLGAVKIECLVPNGNGNSSMGVGSDGNSIDNYLLVDEATTVLPTSWATDYVDLANTNDEDTYTYTDSAQPTGNSVKAAMVWTYAEKTDAGARNFVPVARLSATEITGTTVSPTNGTFNGWGVPFETKPGGGSWTVADINSAEFGLKAT